MPLQSRMLGRIGRRTFTCTPCCDWSRDRKHVRAEENRQWRREAALEARYERGDW